MFLPHVSSEGGPIILGDFDTLRGWRGSFDSSDHYDAACRHLERANLALMPFNTAKIVVWSIGGPGTACIVRVSDSHLSIVRIWPDESWTSEQTEAVMISAATDRFGAGAETHLTIVSGYLLALWAPEDFAECADPVGTEGVPEQLSIGDGGVYMRVACGRYEVSGCEWQTEQYDVTKLDLFLTPDTV